MRYLVVVVTLALPILFTGQSASVADGRAAGLASATSTDAVNPKDTILLVSLEDGSVVMQTISSNADICFKYNADSLTTCLTRGEPILDPSTSAVIGFEMIEEQIDLIAKQD